MEVHAVTGSFGIGWSSAIALRVRFSVISLKKDAMKRGGRKGGRKGCEKKRAPPEPSTASTRFSFSGFCDLLYIRLFFPPCLFFLFLQSRCIRRGPKTGVHWGVSDFFASNSLRFLDIPPPTLPAANTVRRGDDEVGWGWFGEKDGGREGGCFLYVKQ